MDTAGALRVEVGAGLGEGAGTMLLALGDYWQPDRDERTEIGELVHRAKDRGDPGAASELAERFASLATALPHAALSEVALPELALTELALTDVALPELALPELAGGLPRLVVPVPSGPLPAGNGDRPDLAAMLASSLAAAGAGECRPSLVVKSNPTPRLRHLEPGRRAEVVASAGYRAGEPVAGRHVVVVDDVVLTGTTLNAVTACLRDAGAASVTAAAAARTRRR